MQIVRWSLIVALRPRWSVLDGWAATNLFRNNGESSLRDLFLHKYGSNLVFGAWLRCHPQRICRRDSLAVVVNLRIGFSPKADIPALLRKGALEALGGQLDVAHNVLTLNKMGVDVTLKVNGREPLRSGRVKSRRVGMGHSVSCLERDFSGERPISPNGGSRLSYEEDGLYQFDPPLTLSACRAAIVGDAADSRLPDPKDIVAECM